MGNMENEAVDIIAHDGTIPYSTPRICAPNGAASTQVVSPPLDLEPLCSPSSKKMVAGVWANEKTACAPGSAGPCLTDQFDALGRSVDNAAGRSAAEMGRHREMLDHKQRAPCHQQVRASARAWARVRTGARVGVGPRARGQGQDLEPGQVHTRRASAAGQPV